jgi:diguanylate cyclase (GGDEF)-like protein
MDRAAPSGVPSEASFGALFDAIPQAAWLVRLADGRIAAVNAAACALLGRGAGELVGTPALDLASSPEDMAWWDAAAQGELTPLRSHTVIALPDGRALNASRSIQALPPAPGDTPSLALVLLQDRSSDHEADAAREALVAELQATLESTADGILVTDLMGRVRACNRRFAQLWGLPQELLRAVGAGAAGAGGSQRLHDWLARHVVDSDGYRRRLQALQDAPLLHASDRLELRNGQVLERVTRPLYGGTGAGGSTGNIRGRVWSFRDLTDRVAADQRIEALTYNDALTGLPNRRRLNERFAQAARQAHQFGQGFALLVIDLDRFRHINDSLGHAAGDRVLLDVGQRIVGCLRQDDLLARLGGDQFALLVCPADAAAAEATARRVINAVAQPSDADEAQFTLTCSIGVALCPAHGQTADDVLRHAESAMRLVKQNGRANVRLYQARAEGDRRSRMRLDHAMRQALVSGRFRLQYQPQVSLADGALVGAEALLRWRDPELGDVPPARFIPVAEDSGFIVAIGEWVLSQAVRQATLWHQRGHSVPVAVNVSALQFQQAHFVERVASVLALSGLPPQLLELELTESILVHDAHDALQRLNALAALGVKLSIDDFGTGYSSLAYLKRFPIGKLKIDRSFVSGLPGDDSDAGIVRAILQMARALGLSVIAEGVETEAQRQFLLAEGCDQFQGYLYARPLDALSFETRLTSALSPPMPLLPPGGAPTGRARIRLVRT